MLWLFRTARWSALSDSGGEFETDWQHCRAVLSEAARNDAVMAVLWHPRAFNADEFPGYGRLYHRLVETALSLDAWVGRPRSSTRWPASNSRRRRMPRTARVARQGRR